MLPPVSECFFLDVGQGTSQVVLLGNRRAIVIDCGPKAGSFVPLKLLKRYVDRIVALVISHNDSDHLGGATGVLSAYPNAIDQLYVLQDRPIGESPLYSLIESELRSKRLSAPPVRLECDGTVRELFADGTTGIRLRLYSPTLIENWSAQAGRKPNATSGILSLDCGERRIVFPGDSTVEQWRQVNLRNGGAPISCDVCAVPHHGGKVADSDKSEAADLAFLYESALRPKFAVVSVGTSNGDGHPRQRVIGKLVQQQFQVLCTQVTKQCSDDVESLRPGVRTPDEPCRSLRRRDVTTSGKPRNLACAGTVIAEIRPDAVTIHRLKDHESGVDRLVGKPGGHPLCRCATKS